MKNDNRQLMNTDRQVKYEIYILDGLTNRQNLDLDKFLAIDLNKNGLSQCITQNMQK